MLPLNSIIVVYDTQRDAETGVRDLQQVGFDLRKVSILGREHESLEHVVGYYSTGGRMKYWGARGAFWNELWRMLAGAGCFVIPGIGRVLIAGPLTVWVVGALREPIEDLTAVGAGLQAINIPKAGIRRYESALKMHKLLLIAHGSTQEVLKSRDVLRAGRPAEMDVHFVDESMPSAA
jgi:Heat induced stress protein YflT domain